MPPVGVKDSTTGKYLENSQTEPDIQVWLDALGIWDETIDAVRDGDMKYLKIRDNTFLFNVVEDPMEIVPSEAWFRSNVEARDCEVWEQSVLLKEYDVVLTLLCIA